MSNRHPGREECLKILIDNDTPSHVIKHCEKVAEIAVKIGIALNDSGFKLNIQLIQAAGLIHDVARAEDQHWVAGAKLAEELGFFEEASIINEHMTYNTDLSLDTLEEIDIVCLADRMVKEDQYVGLESRMQYILDKFQGNKEASKRITEKLNDNKILIQRIEEKIGAKIDSLI